MKYLIVLLVVVVVAWLLVGRATRRGVVRKDAPGQPTLEAEDMVACAHCGVHLPRGDALVAGAAVYCSDAHRVAGPRAQ
ncbi:MAG TPA: PP0621 family protein [Rubrivivax sp.]